MSRVFGVLALCFVIAACADAQYLVGYGSSDISPTAEQLRRGECFMGGYGIGPTRGRPEGVHDPITARSLVVEDPSTRTTVVMTILDTVGISNILLDRVRSAIRDQTGIPVENIFIGATHTHAGPDLQGLWGGVSAGYKDVVVTGTVNSIISAWRSRVGSRILASKIKVDQIYANNRRDWGYTDTELTALDFVDQVSGRRLLTYVNFQAHPTALSASNMLMSGDWVYYTRLALEEKYGVPSIYFNGPIGDVTPANRNGSEYEGAENYGRKIASYAVTAMEAGQTQIRGGLAVKTAYYNYVITNPLFILAYQLGFLDYNINEDNSIDTRTSYFHFGTDIQAVAFPGESLTRNAEPIKQAMTSPFKIFLGLSGDTLGYHIPSDEWLTGRNGNYEETVSLGKTVGDYVRDLLIRLINE